MTFELKPKGGLLYLNIVGREGAHAKALGLRRISPNMEKAIGQGGRIPGNVKKRGPRPCWL